MQTQVVDLKYKDDREKRILEWAEENIVVLADRINDERVRVNGTSGAPQSTPSPVFESLRAYLERRRSR